MFTKSCLETELVIRAKPSDHQDQWDDFVANLRHISEETIIVPFHNLRPGLPEPKFTLMTQVDEHLSSKSYARYLTSALDCEKSFFPIGADEAGLFQGMYLNLSNLPGKKAMPTCWVHEAVEHLSSAYYSDSKRFVKTIFNGNGTVRKVHISSTPDDNKPKGFVGNWGRELENCGVLILSWVEIDKRFRGRGFGKMLMEKMLECAIKTSQRRGQGQVKFMIVYPEVIRSDLNQDLTAGGFRKAEAQVYINAVGFYRSIGFRRIASTRWYGYALDPNHP